MRKEVIMNYQIIKKLLTAVTVITTLVTSVNSNASEVEMCGNTTTTGNALTLGQKECTTGNGLYFWVDVENDNTPLKISTYGGTGQADILTSTEGWATGSRNDNRTNNPGTVEQLDLIANSGRLYITLYGAHEEVSFKVKDSSIDDGMCGAKTLSDNALTLDQQECISGNGLYYYLDVAEDNTEVTITTSGGSGEADIFVNVGQWAKRSRYTQSSENEGTENNLTVSANAGRLYVSIFGIHQEVSLLVSATTGEADYVDIEKDIQVDIPEPVLSSASEFSDVVNQIIASSWSDWEIISAGAVDPITDVAQAIHFLAAQDDLTSTELDQLMYFLRNYSFFGPYNDFTNEEAQSLSNALQAVANMSNFHSTNSPVGLIHEGYATAILNFTNSPASAFFVDQIPHLLALLQVYSELSDPYTYSNFGNSAHQLVKAIYDMAYYAKNSVALESAFTSNMLNVISVLRSYGLGETGLDLRWNEDEDKKWILSHLFIALGSVSNIADEATQARIDSIIIEIFNKVTNDISVDTAKKEITTTYLATTNRQCDANDPLAQYCIAKPTVDDILSINYQCNDNILIRSQGMTNAQLVSSCNKMTAIEDKFHAFFATNNIPVADDNNQKLEVVVYASPEDYDEYGYEFFNHSTNNGGIYLEGDPSVEGNVARFHAMQCPDSWVPYSCEAGGDVYNLEHEFVHYLDGRYNLHGKFSYHDNTVSWAEGWAEFISKDAGNIRNLDSVIGDYIPPLHNILFMEYGFNDLYPWSYLAMQYLWEERPADVAILADTLRQTDITLYQAELARISASDGDGFLNWVQQNTDAVAPPPQIIPAANTFGSCDLVYQYVRDSSTPSTVSITNNTDTPLTLYWINNSTGEVNFDNPYKTLNNGENYTAEYWKQGDRLVVADQVRNCLAVAVMTESVNTYTIDQAMVADAITSEIIPAANTLGSCDLLNWYERASDSATISITNTTDHAVKLYWVNPAIGEANLTNNYQTLNKGDSYNASAWTQGDRMMIADSENNCLAVAVLTETTNSYTVDESLFNTDENSEPLTGAELYLNLDGEALVNQLANNDSQTVSPLFQVVGTDATQLFSEDNIVSVANAIEEQAQNYSAEDTTGIESMMYYLRAAYYVQYYSPEDIAKYSSAAQESIISALNAFFNNDNSWVVSDANAPVLREAITLVDSANLGAQFQHIIIKVLAEYNEQWKENWGMNGAANAVFTILFRAQWDTEMQTLFAYDDSILDALNNFQLAHRDSLDTDAEYVLINAVRELARLYHIEEMIPRVKVLVKGIIDSTNKDDSSKVLWLAAASMADYYDRADCNYYDICGFAYTLEAETLTFNYKCSDSLKIRAQALYNDQGDWICGVLGQQESNFHQMLETLEMPVADDNNTSLELVIFNSSDDYGTYAGQFFNINTNNGGMYLEGAPSDVKNQARFIAYEAEWKRPNFHVWNLQHEYVHYLDARFNLYGDFANGLSANTIWWTEGLAEYISNLDDNTRAINLGETQEYSLSEIFKNDYSVGQDRIYRWGYLAVRFMFENHPDDVTQILSYMRNNQFSDYQTLIDNIGSSYDEEWNLWLVSTLSTQSSGIVEFGPSDDEALSSGQAGNWEGDPVTISTDFSPCIVEFPQNKYEKNKNITFDSSVECITSESGRASFAIPNPDGLASSLLITTSGGWGNADILYKVDGRPSAQDNDGMANGDGNDDNITVELAADVYWHYITLSGEFGGMKMQLTVQ